MLRTLAALIVVSCVSSAHAQGVLNRAGEALDNAGRNIRQGVENAVARGEISAHERNLLGLVGARIRGDKRLVGSAVQMEVRADGSVILRGSVASTEARAVAAELVENTVGVTTVVDELAVAKEVKVIGSTPAPKVIVADPGAKVIVSEPVEPATKVIVKP